MRLEARLAKLERAMKPGPIYRWLGLDDEPGPDTIDGRPVVYISWTRPQDDAPDT